MNRASYLNGALDIRSQIAAGQLLIEHQSVGALHLRGGTTAARVVPTAIVRIGHHRHTERTDIVAELQLAFGQVCQRTNASLGVVLQSADATLLDYLAVETDVESVARPCIRHIVHSHFGAQLQVFRVIRVGDGHCPHQDNERNY